MLCDLINHIKHQTLFRSIVVSFYPFSNKSRSLNLRNNCSAGLGSARLNFGSFKSSQRPDAVLLMCCACVSFSSIKYGWMCSCRWVRRCLSGVSFCAAACSNRACVGKVQSLAQMPRSGCCSSHTPCPQR